MLILITVVMTLGIAVPVQGNEGENIRVRLAGGTSTMSFRIVHGSYQLRDLATNILIADLKEGDLVTVNKAGSNVTVNINNSITGDAFFGPLIAVPKEKPGLNVFSFLNTQYRGTISVYREPAGLLIVNTLNCEHYLYGVVGQEMGYTAPLEALKAQAVVSRSFALSFRGSALKYDVGTGQSSQVYRGYSAEKVFGTDKIVEAVQATQGKVMYYVNKSNGTMEIVKAFFHANAGGYTENSENVWNEELPYLKAVSSPEDVYALEYSEQTGQEWPKQSFRWEVTLSRDQIDQAIQDYNKKTSSPINIGGFQEMRLKKLDRDGKHPTASGRVTEVELIGTRGKASVFRDGIRSLFGLKSTKFDLVTGSGNNFFIMDGSGEKYQMRSPTDLVVIRSGPKVDLIGNTSGDWYVRGRGGITELDEQGPGDIFTFRGQGYGHGVGMSQWGAQGMAVKGSSFRKILEHYYNQDKEDGRLVVE